MSAGSNGLVRGSHPVGAIAQCDSVPIEIVDLALHYNCSFLPQSRSPSVIASPRSSYAMPPKASTSAGSSSPALSVQEFLKLLTSRKTLTMSQAMKAAGALLPKSYNNLEALRRLTPTELEKLGLEEGVVKGIGELVGKGGKGKAAASGKGKGEGKRKRKANDDDESMIKPPREVIESEFVFEEYEDERAIVGRSVVVNRSPVMVAWAFIVCERLGFTRSESLSIAHVYNELNAISKGVSIGIMPASANQPITSSDQPYIDLMGRRIPVLKLKSGEWRALSKGEITEPSKAFGYMTRAFRQQLGSVIGAMRILADAFSLDDLNTKGYGFYCDFRPDVSNGVSGWGAKGTVLLKTILDLRPVDHQKLKKEDVKHDADQTTGLEAKEERGKKEGMAGKVKVRGNKKIKVEQVDLTLEDGPDGEKPAASPDSVYGDEFDYALDDDFDDALAGAEELLSL